MGWSLLVVAVAAATTLVAGCAPTAVQVSPVSTPPAARDVCEDLVADLPTTVASLERRDVEPPDALAAAWGDPAVVLSCGVGRPDDYDPANGCLTVNGVDWYVPVSQLEGNGARDLTMTTIKRDVAVRVDMPGVHWPPATVLADLTAPVQEAHGAHRTLSLIVRASGPGAAGRRSGSRSRTGGSCGVESGG